MLNPLNGTRQGIAPLGLVVLRQSRVMLHLVTDLLQRILHGEQVLRVGSIQLGGSHPYTTQFSGLLHQSLQLRFIPRLRNVLVDSPLVDGINDRINVRVTREQHSNRIRMVSHDHFKEFYPTDVGHFLI